MTRRPAQPAPPNEAPRPAARALPRVETSARAETPSPDAAVGPEPPDSDGTSPAPTADGAPSGAPAPRVPFEPAFTWDDPVRLMKSLGLAWREVTDRETPTFLQLMELGVTRVDVDEPTGFVAVHVEDEAHHAIGLRREAIVPLVAVLTGRVADEVRRAVSQGPAKIESAPRAPKPAKKPAAS